jgi:DNA-binding beta-propeller fold protein YncE
MNQEDALRSEIHEALDPIAGPTPELLPRIVQRFRPASRRPYRAMGQVAAVLGILIVGAIVFSTHRSRVATGPITTSPAAPIVAGPGANIAWVTSQQASGSIYTGDIVTGIDPAGHVVGRFNAENELRSADGSHLYALVGAEVHVHSATDGHLESIISVPLMAGGLDMLSPDGRYLAIVTGSRVQLVDLSDGRVTDALDFGSPTYGVPIIVGPQAQHIYIVRDTVTRLTFDGARLRVDGHSTGKALSCNGLAVGGGNTAGGLPFRVLADGRTLVAFCPGDGRVDWFDLVQMKLTHEVVVTQRNPFWVSPVFSPDGNTLYLFEGGTGSLHAIDLVHRTIIKSTKVATADANPLAWLRSLLIIEAYAGGIDRTAAVSPDGTFLYTVGDFGAPGGVSLVHLPDQAVKGRWSPDVSLKSVWVSADGRTVYLLENGDQLRVLRTDGSLVAKLALPAYADVFIVPTIP